MVPGHIHKSGDSNHRTSPAWARPWEWPDPQATFDSFSDLKPMVTTRDPAFCWKPVFFIHIGCCIRSIRLGDMFFLIHIILVAVFKVHSFKACFKRQGPQTSAKACLSGPAFPWFGSWSCLGCSMGTSMDWKPSEMGGSSTMGGTPESSDFPLYINIFSFLWYPHGLETSRNESGYRCAKWVRHGPSHSGRWQSKCTWVDQVWGSLFTGFLHRGKKPLDCCLELSGIWLVCDWYLIAIWLLFDWYLIAIWLVSESYLISI